MNGETDKKPEFASGTDPFEALTEQRARGLDWHLGALWFARIVVALICIWNLTAAIPFVLDPSAYVRAFELESSGPAGEIMVRGLGITFLMWQVPFLPVVRHPDRHRTCFLCVLCMQLLGLVGESIMLAHLPGGHAPLRATARRFILFDAAGLVLMALAYVVLRWKRGAGRTR